MKKGILYEIVNIVTTQRYIGVTTMTLRARWGSHLWKLRHGKHSPKLQAAFDEYGEGAFKIMAIKEGLLEDMLLIEKELTENTVISGYNSIVGGGGSEERGRAGKTHQQKLRIDPILKSAFYKKVAQSNTGKKMSSEAKRKMSEKKMGTRWSDELKKKISKMRIGRPGTRDNYYLHTGVGVFYSTRELQKEFAVSRTTIKNWHKRGNPKMIKYINA